MLGCFNHLCSRQPRSSDSAQLTLPVTKWYQGFHLRGTFTYEKIRTLQCTKFSQVEKISSQGKDWVLKTAISDAGSRGIEQEVRILAVLNAAERKKPQKCVIDLIALVRSNGRPAMLLPFCQIDLLDRIRKDHGLDLESSLNVLHQMFRVLAFLKKNNIFHRDIKPENIFFLKDDEIRLADFGLSMVKGDIERSKMACGTPEFLSPELLTALDAELEIKPYDFASDMWATACTMFMAASCQPLVQCEVRSGWRDDLVAQQKNLLWSLQSRMDQMYQPKSKVEVNFIKSFQKMLTEMLDHDPKARLIPEDGLCFFTGKVIEA